MGTAQSTFISEVTDKFDLYNAFNRKIRPKLDLVGFSEYCAFIRERDVQEFLTPENRGSVKLIKQKKLSLESFVKGHVGLLLGKYLKDHKIKISDTLNGDIFYLNNELKNILVCHIIGEDYQIRSYEVGRDIFSPKYAFNENKMNRWVKEIKTLSNGKELDVESNDQKIVEALEIKIVRDVYQKMLQFPYHYFDQLFTEIKSAKLKKNNKISLSEIDELLK